MTHKRDQSTETAPETLASIEARLDAGAESLTLRFEREKETKRTVRFQEVLADEDAGQVVGGLYVSKDVLAVMGEPSELTVTIAGGGLRAAAA